MWSRTAFGAGTMSLMTVEKAVELIGTGDSVQDAVTEALDRARMTLEGLTGRTPFTDLHEAGRTMDHIRLARWADVAVLCPATASSMNRLAAGLADDAIGALFLAWELAKKPYLIAPAMNATMWEHPATRAARERLARSTKSQSAPRRESDLRSLDHHWAAAAAVRVPALMGSRSDPVGGRPEA